MSVDLTKVAPSLIAGALTQALKLYTPAAFLGMDNERQDWVKDVEIKNGKVSFRVEADELPFLLWSLLNARIGLEDFLDLETVEQMQRE